LNRQGEITEQKTAALVVAAWYHSSNRQLY
jgi:hypothetical protein